MSEPIEQHTNPRMSLKRFTEKGKPLHVVDHGEIDDISKDKASVIPNFYTAEFLQPNDKYKYETDFCKIETKASKVFDKFQKNVYYSPRENELETILTFVSWQFLRTKVSRDETEKMLKGIITDPKLYARITQNSDFFIKCMAKNFDLVFEALSSRIMGVNNFTSEEDFLVTSDNPILMVSKDGYFSSSSGIGSADIVAYPLSRYFLLTFTPAGHSLPRLERMSDRGLSFAQDFNLALYHTSNSRIYCHPSDSEKFRNLLIGHIGNSH